LFPFLLALVLPCTPPLFPLFFFDISPMFNSYTHSVCPMLTHPLHFAQVLAIAIFYVSLDTQTGAVFPPLIRLTHYTDSPPPSPPPFRCPFGLVPVCLSLQSLVFPITRVVYIHALTLSLPLDLPHDSPFSLFPFPPPPTPLLPGCLLPSGPFERSTFF